MLPKVTSLFRLLSLRRAAFAFGRRRWYSSEKDDGSSKRPKDGPFGEDSPQRRQLIDVTEYYSQYIKEYEQGGFKDEETVQWESRRDKLNITRGRGETAVIDLDELIEFLRGERIKEICTLKMPKSSGNAPYMVIGTPLSRRHMVAMTDKLRKAYKQKRAVYDPPSIRIADRTNQEWRVFDLDNAIVHLMLPKVRQRYDIEMLWAVGPDLDDQTNSAGELDEYDDRLKKLQEEIDVLSNASSDNQAPVRHEQ